MIPGDIEIPSPQEKRRHTLNSIRTSLQMPELTQVMKKNSLAVENKLERRRFRKESLKVESEDITDIQINEMLEKIENEENSVKTIGKFMEKYELGSKIGEGSNGLVRKCYLKSTKELFAVKTIMMDEEHIMFLKKNFKNIKALNHPNVIRYHCMYLEKSKSLCHLVMDYEEHPNLMKFKDLSETEIRSIIYQLLNTLAYIHEKHICHRDIKPENILYNYENKKIKIIDFGISKKNFARGTKKEMLTITGTLFYRAPEMFDGGGYDEKVDIWAAGITLYQLLSKGKTPFESEYLTTTIENIRNGKVEFEEEVWKEYCKSGKDLVIRLLKKYSDRPRAEEAKNHFWFTELLNTEKLDKYKSASFKNKNSSFDKSIKNNSEDFSEVKFERTFTSTEKIEFYTPNKDSPESPENKIMKKKGLLQSWLAESDDEEEGLVDEEEEEENKKSNITV